MNKYFLLLLFCSIGYSQASGLTLFGIGEDIRDSDPASIAMGNSKFFSGNSKNISTGSPSSLWRSALTRFSIQSGMNYLTVSSFPKQFQHNLTHFSLIFPVGDKKVVGFGLQQAFRTAWGICRAGCVVGQIRTFASDNTGSLSLASPVCRQTPGIQSKADYWDKAVGLVCSLVEISKNRVDP